MSITATSLWSDLSEDRKLRLLALAKNYILQGKPDTAEWIDIDQTFHSVAVVVYEALRLLHAADGAWLATLEPEVRAKWMPIALTYSSDSQSEGHRMIIALLHRSNPTAFAAFVARIVLARATRGREPIELDQLFGISSPELDRTLLSLATDATLTPVGTGDDE